MVENTYFQIRAPHIQHGDQDIRQETKTYKSKFGVYRYVFRS
jgi:hypothetical protein